LADIDEADLGIQSRDQVSLSPDSAGQTPEARPAESGDFIGSKLNEFLIWKLRSMVSARRQLSSCTQVPLTLRRYLFADCAGVEHAGGALQLVLESALQSRLSCTFEFSHKL